VPLGDMIQTCISDQKHAGLLVFGLTLLVASRVEGSARSDQCAGTKTRCLEPLFQSLSDQCCILPRLSLVRLECLASAPGVSLSLATVRALARPFRCRFHPSDLSPIVSVRICGGEPLEFWATSLVVTFVVALAAPDGSVI